MDREQAAREIADTSRVVRKHAPGWLWAIAIVVALICIVPLVRAWFATPGEVTTATPPEPGSGLGTGIALGFVGGIVVGFAVARVTRRGSSTRP
nr:hypothetical protein [Kofleriaceae bacterium]